MFLRLVLETESMIIGQSESYQSMQTYLKNLPCNNCRAILTTYFQNFDVVSEKVLAPTHHCLLLIVEKREKAVGNKKVFGAFLTDLSKAINCVSHDLLIAKLRAYRLSFTALRLLMQDYLKKSQTANKKLNLRLPTATGKIQWTQQVKSTSTWCRHYVDTSKVKHRRIYTSFRRTFSM